MITPKRLYREGEEGKYRYYIKYAAEKHYVNFGGNTGGLEVTGDMEAYFVELGGHIFVLDVDNVW